MKIQKTMTAKALAANRANARKSTGPRRTEAVSQNARKHGLLSKKFVFESEEDKHEFEQLLEDVQQHENPVGPIERVLVEETAVCIWKLQMANGREVKEFENRRVASDALMQTLAESHRFEKIPLFTRPVGQLLTRTAGGNVRNCCFAVKSGITRRSVNRTATGKAKRVRCTLRPK